MKRILWFLAAAPNLAWAQAAADSSIGPVVEDLAEVITMLEDKSIQITDISLGTVKDDGLGVSVPLAMLGPANAVVVAVGDERRIVDLDLAVTDGRGSTFADSMNDNAPLVQFDTPGNGDWTAKVVIVDPVPGTSEGYYMLVTGYPLDGGVISASSMVTVLALINTYAEGYGLTFVHGVMKVMDQGKNSMIELSIPTGTWSQCAVFGFGDPERVKKVGMSVADPNGNVIGKGKKSGAFSFAIVNATGSSSRYLVTMSPKIGKSYGDAHGMAIVACQ